MRRQQEEQMRRQQEEQMRHQQEEEMRRQQEEQMRRQQEEEMARQAEMRRQEEEMMMRQREEQMQLQRMQQEEEQRVMQQQQRIQQEEQQRQMLLQQQQQMMQQQSVQQTQQQMVEQQQIVQQQSQQTTIQQKIAKAGGFSYGAIPTKGPQTPQPAMPPMSSSSMSFESSQQSQQFSSVQQSSSSSFSQHQQSSNQVFESQEFNGGPVMKGLPRREEEANNRDSGIFTGINGDANSLVDDEFDYKKHTVKDLAKHFALVKPKQNIPHNILPEQRMFNGDHAPQLNYLGANESGAVLQSNTSNRREVSQQDIEASKAAYELKKKQQLEQQSTTTTTQSSSSTVVRRTETSSSSTEQKTERRMSLRDSLMLDPAKAHLDAGLIDPSAILRGSDITGRRSTSEGMNQSSVQGETDKVLNKWDNHNTIARGWTNVKANYHPVTFRNIYNVDTQKNESSLQL